MTGSGAFVGRERQLAVLAQELDGVRRSGRGAFVLLRGRRRIGKSRLVSEFLDRHDVPSVFFAAGQQPPGQELARFAEAVARSDLPAAAAVASGTSFASWEAALTTLAATSRGQAFVVVLDELPYLLARDPGLEAQLQHTWDRVLEAAPVLLVAIGSDLSSMAALTSYGRPLYGRPTRELVLQPLSVGEVGGLLGLAPAEAFDAALVVGGFPLVARSWPPGAGVMEFLRAALADPTSPLIVTAERALAAEFPDPLAGAVLRAVGAGEATFGGVGRATGIPATTLRRILDLLRDKGAVAEERPLSARPAPKTARLRIADPYLRFWLRFVAPGLEEIERGRPDLALERVAQGWPAYRGSAVEPLVRAALDRLLPDARLGVAQRVGAYWTRAADVEVDLVGTAGTPARPTVVFVGSVKWRDREPLGRRDVIDLQRARERVPGADADTLLVAVSRDGRDPGGLDLVLGPDDLLATA